MIRWGNISTTWQGFFLMAVFCLAIAVFITLLGVADGFLHNLIVSCAIGFSVSSAHLLRPLFDRMVSRGLSAAIATFLGLILGLLIGGLLLVGEPLFFFSNQFTALLLALFFGVIGFAIFGSRERAMKARQALVELEAARTLQEKKTVEVQLRMLQAQIEPHFLFNTLSNIVGMIKMQPAVAEKMLLKLTKLLRSSLQRTREAVTTVGNELELVEAYLEIQRIRMGERLTFQFHIDASVRDIPLAPLLLQPLVENALRHGIDPLEKGGNIVISAKVGADSTFNISVSDTGVGIATTTSGVGVGIENVQQRLQTLYDGKASLLLTENKPCGTVATLTLPRDH